MRRDFRGEGGDGMVACRAPTFVYQDAIVAGRDSAFVERDPAFVERAPAFVERVPAFVERDSNVARRLESIVCSDRLIV